MNTRSVSAIIAGFVMISHGITPALAYYPSNFGQSSMSRATQRTSSSSSSMSSSMSSKASESSSSASSISSPWEGKSPTTAGEKLKCVKFAAQMREDAIQKTLDMYYQKMSKMLAIRRDLITKFWSEGNAKKRDQGLRAVWRTFGQAWRNNGNDMREQRREAWDAYRNARSACGVYESNDPEMGGLGVDSQY